MSYGIEPKALTKDEKDSKNEEDVLLMEVKIPVRDLSFKMLQNENNKMRAFNTYMNNQRIDTSMVHGQPTKEEIYLKDLNELDAKGYELSLQFNDLLLSNGYVHCGADLGVDAARVSAEYLLNQYDLKYPVSWDMIENNPDGLRFTYHSSERVESDKAVFMSQVDKLFAEAKIDDNDFTRISAAADYFAKHRKLLSKHINKEDIDIFEGSHKKS